MKCLEYEIKETPNPRNPNEQAEGSIIDDDRIFKKNVVSINHNDQNYNKGKFTKLFLSNQLIAPLLTFEKGDKVTIFFKKKENPSC